MMTSRYLLIIAALPLLLLFTSCEKIKGKGDVYSDYRNVSGFSGISLSMEGDLYFTPDSNYTVEIQAQQNVLDVIETYVQGGNLVIQIEKDKILGKHEPIKIYIRAPSVKNLDISGSGNITADSVMHQPRLDYHISGSGNIDIDELNSGQMFANISGSGNMSGSSGITDYENLTISGSGNMNFTGVTADSVFVNISGSGSAKTWAVKFLDVTISGSGSVKYNGNPTINLHISGSGTVSHI
jgi:hypothetical protein